MLGRKWAYKKKYVGYSNNYLNMTLKSLQKSIVWLGYFYLKAEWFGRVDQYLILLETEDLQTAFLNINIQSPKCQLPWKYIKVICVVRNEF